MKKPFIYLSVILIGFLLVLNVYIYTSQASVTTNLNQNTQIQDKIKQLDSFRLNIVSLAHAQKSYLLTGDSKYLGEYKNLLEKSYASAKELQANNTISTESLNQLNKDIQSYDTMNSSIWKQKLTFPIGKDIENKVIQSNEIQLNILHQSAVFTAEYSTKIEESSKNVSNSLKSQKNFVQIISSFFTILLAGPLYFLKNFFTNNNNQFGSLVEKISSTIREDKNGSELNPSYLKTFAQYNEYMKGQWTENHEIIQNIEALLKETEHSTQLDLEMQRLHCLSKQLPHYHEFITNLTNNSMKNENNS